MLGFVLLIMTLEVRMMMHRGVLHFGGLALIRAVKYCTGSLVLSVQVAMSLLVPFMYCYQWINNVVMW